MQKKIIALAVAGLVSSVAFAQSNVTVYGIVDMGYVYQGDSGIRGVDSYSALDDGGQDGSRFGFKGTEDLGNGMSANFYTEFAYRLDHTNANGVGVSKAYVSLSGKNWGEAKLGSFGTPADDYSGYGKSGNMSWGETVIGNVVNADAYNAVKYLSPNWSGFSFQLGASTNYQNSADTPSGTTLTNDGETPAWFGGLSYVNGGLKLGFAFDSVTRNLDNYDKQEYDLSAGYDFGAFQIGALYGYATAQADYVGLGTLPYDVTRQAWSLSAGWNITAKDHLGISWSQSQLDHNKVGFDDYDASAWGMSYTHALSKRTNFYAAGFLADADRGFIGPDTVTGATAGNAYQQGVKLGIRHQF